jgi:hypothetical protein
MKKAGDYYYAIDDVVALFHLGWASLLYRRGILLQLPATPFPQRVPVNGGVPL